MPDGGEAVDERPSAATLLGWKMGEDPRMGRVTWRGLVGIGPAESLPRAPAALSMINWAQTGPAQRIGVGVHTPSLAPAHPSMIG